jgi:hypothetical protein
MRLSVRHSMKCTNEFVSAGEFSGAVEGEPDAGKSPALCPSPRVFLPISGFHTARCRSNRKDNSAQRPRQRLRLCLRRRLHIRVREF